jgi:Skp family chaperone for outer membrane proteins
MKKRSLIWLHIVFILSACSSTSTTISPLRNCAEVDLQKIASSSREVVAAKGKISQQLEPKRRELNAMLAEKQKLELILQSDQKQSDSSRVELMEELKKLDKEITQKNIDLDTELKSAMTAYNRYLLNYMVQVISAKAGLDGIDVIYDEHKNVIVNKNPDAKIDCSGNIQNYTEKIISITNR